MRKQKFNRCKLPSMCSCHREKAGRGFLKKTLFAFPLESCTLFAFPLEYFALTPSKNLSFKLSSDTRFRWNLHKVMSSDSLGKLTEGWTDFARKGGNLI